MLIYFVFLPTYVINYAKSCFVPRPCHFFIFQVSSHKPFLAACQDVSVIGSERKRPRGIRGAFDFFIVRYLLLVPL